MLRVLDAGNLHTSHRCCVIVKEAIFIALHCQVQSFILSAIGIE